MQEYDGSTNLQEYDAAAARDLVLGEQREYVGEPLAAGGHEIGVKQLSRGAWDAVLRHTGLRQAQLELGRVLPFMWRMRMSGRCSSHTGKPPPLVSAQM